MTSLKNITFAIFASTTFVGAVHGADGYTNVVDLTDFTNPSGVILSSDGTSGHSGFANVGGGSIGTFTNNGTLTAPGGNGFFNNRPITTWVNNGTVSGTDNLTDPGTGFFQYISTIGTLTNTGTISGTARAFYIYADGNITNFNNTTTGIITGSGLSDPTIYLNARIVNFANAGLIEGISTAAIQVDSSGSYGLLNNSGEIKGNTGLINSGSIEALTNSGLIRGFGPGSQIGIQNTNTGVISSFVNSGNVRALAYGLQNDAGGVITAIVNEAGGVFGAGGAGILNNGTITSVINHGSMSGVFGVGISNAGVITTLSNAQTNLSFSGTLPENYNVIVSSPTQYGKLTVSGVSGTTNFGIYTGSVVTKGTYLSVLSGVSAANLNTATGGYNGFRWTLNNASGSVWDLVITGASTVDTQTSVENVATALRHIYTLQNAVLVNSLNHDCSVFDTKNLCVSAGGRYSTTQSDGMNNTGTLLVVAYRPYPHYHFGAFLDQSMSGVNAGVTVNTNINVPLVGFFGVWNESGDGTGTNIKLAAAYGQRSATITRQVINTSEAGSGSSELNSQGVQLTAKYGVAVAKDILMSPYVGLRHTQNNMRGYTEGISTEVTAPLTYASLGSRATTLLAGVEGRYRFASHAAVLAGVGLEHHSTLHNDSYAATGIDGVTPVSFSPNAVKTRGAVNLGMFYDVRKNQRLGLAAVYRQEPSRSVSSTSAMLTYSFGL